MKKISTILFFISSLIILPACQADKSSETSSTSEATPKVSDTKANDAKSSGADIHPGKELHDTNCMGCHGTDVYTRDDRKIQSLDKLAARVRMCDSQLQTQLFPEDLEQITDYLNTAFYKFEK